MDDQCTKCGGWFWNESLNPTACPVCEQKRKEARDIYDEELADAKREQRRIDEGS